MKNRSYKFILLLISILTFTSCELSIGGITNTDVGGTISTNTDVGYDIESIYESSIKVKTTDSDYLTKDNFTFDNVDANFSAKGFISATTDGFVIGNNIETGEMSFNFYTPIQIDQIELDLYAYSERSLETTIYYNDSSFSAILTKKDTFIKTFDSPISLNSIKFVGGSSYGRIKFNEVRFSLHKEINVTGIEKIKDMEAVVGKLETLDSSYYSILPNNASNKQVILSCDSDFVEIDNQKIKCLQEGNYVVNVTTVDGGFSTSINVTAENEIIPEAVEKLYKEDIRFTYDDVYKSSQTEGIIPSVGRPNILVVPVNFSDLINIYDFNDKTSIDRLNAVFNGTNEDYTNSYSHSLKSFYLESSYGALDMNFIITDTFTPTFSSSSFISKESKGDGEGVYKIIEEFYKSGKIDGTRINFKDSKYDINHDGFVDGVWFIYNDNRFSTSESYWPYTYWYYAIDDQGYILDTDVNISCFANMSVYFTYEDSAVGEDYHTLVHETGHMLGLDDYYSYDDRVRHSATGDLDMMDANIGDHNAFSKFSLGWVEPYILKDEGEVILNPFESTGDCLIIPSSYFNDSAFSEYLILEFYTPTGLNRLDSTIAYPNRNLYFNQIGVRMFHIDARLLKLDYSPSIGYYSSGVYLDENATTISSSGYSYYYIGSSNTKSYSYNGYHLIEAVTSNNVSTYNSTSTSNRSLFSQGDVFNPMTYTSFFINGKMHDGLALGYKVEFLEMTNETCKLNIVKL